MLISTTVECGQLAVLAYRYIYMYSANRSAAFDLSSGGVKYDGTKPVNGGLGPGCPIELDYGDCPPHVASVG